MRSGKINRHFWLDKKILLTGHTGFKGSWLAFWLKRLGANVSGLALPPKTKHNLHAMLNTSKHNGSDICNLQDKDAVFSAVKRSRPQIVIHMAAQALVRYSYNNPLETFSTNIMGTIHLLEALRESESVQSILVITSDKVYENTGTVRRFKESSSLGGIDPYSASKSCQDIISHSYRQSFFARHKTPLASARAGNVIGGGDWADDRLMTDIETSILCGEPIVLRNPLATRPWQHVLEPLAGYLLYIQALADGKDIPFSMNFAPDSSASVKVVVEKYLAARNAPNTWKLDDGANPHEAHALEIDPTLAQQTLGWHSLLNIDRTIEWVADWHNATAAGENALSITERQIKEYETLMDVES